MKKPVYFLAMAAIVGFASCNKSDNPTPPPPPAVAKVKFTNAAAGSGDVNIWLNDTVFNAAMGLGMLESTGYLSTTPGNGQEVSIKLASTNVELDNVVTNFTSGNNYSVFEGGTLGAATDAVVTSDDLSAPASGKFKVRFINLSQEPISPDVYIGAAKIDSTISYKQYTQFATVTAGTMNVKVLDPLNIPSSPADLTAYSFVAGKIYTIILSGIIGGSGGAEQKLTVTTNN